jgi:phosphoribosylamine--glycine ligase
MDEGKMKVLVVGSGGREHALAWKISQSRRVEKVFAAPGNDGFGDVAESVSIKSEDFPRLADFVDKYKIDYTVVGPELPLTLGIVDKFEEWGFKIFGPSKRAAEIEGSKVFAKEFIKKLQIPTGDFKTFTDRNKAIKYLRDRGAPIVIKVSGLAAGKGVTVAKDIDTAIQAVDHIMVEQIFGKAGSEIVIEEYLEGEEVTILAFTDGKTVLPLLPSQDHKPLLDEDQGPNTGGMGAYAPAPIVNDEMLTKIEEEILKPVVMGLADEGRAYKGVLYAGLIMTLDGPKVMEFNCRFGDPEAQVILPLLDVDLMDVITAISEGRLEHIELNESKRAAACVVLASKGYPGNYDKGILIEGLEDVSKLEDVILFHAGTRSEDQKYFTNGGRVLGVTGMGDGLEEAIQTAYSTVDMIQFEGMYYRKDIGAKGLVALK